MSLADPTMFPLYAKAQDLDLTISVHVGGDLRDSRRQPGNAMHANMMTSPGAFCFLVGTGNGPVPAAPMVVPRSRRELGALRPA